MFTIRLTIRKDLPPPVLEKSAKEELLALQDVRGDQYGFILQRGNECWLQVHHVGMFVAESGYSNVLGFPDEGVDPCLFQEAFFHGVAPLLLQRGPWECLHGSAVLRDGRVTVFCGPSGRGKSTLAGASTDRGALLYADDAVPLLPCGDIVMSARIPQRLRLREPASSWFPEASLANGGAGSGSEIFYDLETTLRPVRCIYWLEPAEALNGNGVLLEKVPPVEAFRLLLGQAHCVSLKEPACNGKMIRNYLSLARLTPVFRLRFDRGLDRIPAVLDRLDRHEAEIPGGPGSALE